MKLKNILCALAIGSSGIALAQDSTGVDLNTATFRVLNDDPKLPFVHWRLPGIGISYGAHNTSYLTSQFGVDWQYNEKWFMSATASVNLLDRQSPSSVESGDAVEGNFVQSIYKPTPSNYVRAEAIYFITSKEKTSNGKVTLGYSNKKKFTKEGAHKVLWRSGLNFGLAKGTTWYHLQGDKFSLEEGEIDAEDQSSYLNYTHLRLGWAFNRSVNFQTESSANYNQERMSGNYFYANVLIAIQQRFDEVYAYDTTFNGSSIPAYAKYDVNEFNDMSPIGFEVGWKYIPVNGGFSFHAAAGTLPGLKGASNPYFETGIAFSIVSGS